MCEVISKSLLKEYLHANMPVLTGTVQATTGPGARHSQKELHIASASYSWIIERRMAIQSTSHLDSCSKEVLVDIYMQHVGYLADTSTDTMYVCAS